jgi:hypothetical protein
MRSSRSIPVESGVRACRAVRTGRDYLTGDDVGLRTEARRERRIVCAAVSLWPARTKFDPGYFS